MKKSYIKCPYCEDEVSLSGSSMHVKNKHTDKYAEFKANYPELKKHAVIKESSTKTPAEPGKEPPRIEDTGKPEDKLEDKKQPQAGDGKPQEGKSFLRDFDEWLGSDKF